ncbi:response regulator [Jiangella ureilytica]|uniref:Response regulator n=1 Tax=Jiangella ureilytica TaxID=2530374 RepID=A0A4V2XWN2_9ACTN|nr:response regulator [Jiangella ureilytica]TDC49975.1 response regulator [Jiangella ureilytica]
MEQLMTIDRQRPRRRPRILLVDDQRDVAHTLSKLLKPLNAEFRFAEDGDAGLRRLRTEMFDLVLVDLFMPPGDVGGMWLLRRLAEDMIRIPTVILSGNEAQDETIEAQRLGAKNYVVKHKATEELLDVVKEVLADAAHAHWQVATSELPAPVAIPLIRSRLQTDDMHRLRDSIHCVESIFRFSALAAAASFRDLLAERLEKPPSMGTWQSLCRELQGQTAGGVLRDWLTTVADRSAADLVSVRNDLAHGGVPVASWVKERQRDVDDWLELFVTVAATRPALRTVVAGKLEHTGDGFVAEVANLVGSATAVRWQEFHAAEPLRKGRVYLVVADEPVINLWPLITSTPDDRPGHWSISVLDGVTRNGQLRYINLDNGTRVDSEITVADLRSCR